MPPPPAHKFIEKRLVFAFSLAALLLSPAIFPLGLATLASVVGCHNPRTSREGATTQVQDEAETSDEPEELLLGTAPTGAATACPTPTPTPVYTQEFFPTNLKPFGCWSDLIPGPTVPFTDGWKYTCTLSDSACTYGGKQCSSLETGGLCKICWPSSEDGNSHGQINRLCIGTTCTNTGSCPNKRLKPKFWDSATDVSGVALPVNDPSQQMTCVSGTAQVQENYCKDEAGNYELAVKETAYLPQGDVTHFTKKNQSCVNTKALCAEGKRETELGGVKVGINCAQVPTPSPCAAPDGCPPGYRTSILPTPTPNPTPGPTPVPRWKVSELGRQYIQASEGTGKNGHPLEAYSKDSKGTCNCTIGYGTLIHVGRCEMYSTPDASSCPPHNPPLSASELQKRKNAEMKFVQDNSAETSWVDAKGISETGIRISEQKANDLFVIHIATIENVLNMRLRDAKGCMTQALYDSYMAVYYQMRGKMHGKKAEIAVKECNLSWAEQELTDWRKAGESFEAGLRKRRCGEGRARNRGCADSADPYALCNRPRVMGTPVPSGGNQGKVPTLTICESKAKRFDDDGNPELDSSGSQKVGFNQIFVSSSDASDAKNYIQAGQMSESQWKTNCGW